MNIDAYHNCKQIEKFNKLLNPSTITDSKIGILISNMYLDLIEESLVPNKLH